jgi:hypothetical protein
MSVVSITVQDETNPVELQNWFDAHTTAVVVEITNDGRTFFIFYT